MATKETRIAIVSKDKCKPKKCALECKRGCPVNRSGKRCIDVSAESKISFISESLCIGCGICVKKCPYTAITIINIPSNLDKDTIHRFGPNSFKLHRLPMPRPGEVLGLVGTNGIGKSTAIKILGGKLKPNLGRYKNPPDWQEILNHFRGSELQNYFKKIIEDTLKISMKPQHTEVALKVIGDKMVSELLERKDERGVKDQLARELDLTHLLERKCSELSGGELQRLCIACASASDASVYFYDEPSSYLDVKQRLQAAHTIRDTLGDGSKYVVVIEHDLSVLDYLSDYICCLYGTPSLYGVVTMPFSVREGINIFLDGVVPTENLRFREEALIFKIAETASDIEVKHTRSIAYPAMAKSLGSFKLDIETGKFSDSEIIVMLGENGTGKTTFIKLLAGSHAADGNAKTPALNVSHKPQNLKGTSEKTVRNFFLEKIRDSYLHPQFISDVVKPLRIEDIHDRPIKELSGGELQRVAIALCLGKPADVYLIDEPSANLDSEQRIIAARVIKRFVLHAKKTAFVVEHDFIMATYLADRVIVFDGSPGLNTTAHSPQSLLSGMNSFLENLGITFRRDPTNYRPRINKKNSVKDVEQKRSKNYFYLDEA